MPSLEDQEAAVGRKKIDRRRVAATNRTRSKEVGFRGKGGNGSREKKTALRSRSQNSVKDKHPTHEKPQAMSNEAWRGEKGILSGQRENSVVCKKDATQAKRP